MKQDVTQNLTHDLTDDFPVLDELVGDVAVQARSAPYEDGGAAPLVSKAMAYSRLLPYLLITALCLPIQILLRRVSGPRVWERFCRWYHARAVRL